MFLHSDRGRCSTHQHQPHSCRQWSPEDMYRNIHPPDLYRHLRFDMGWKHTHLFPTHNVDLDVNYKDIPCNSIGVLKFKNIQFNVLYYIIRMWTGVAKVRCWPVNPSGQLHVKWFTSSKQSPSFKHGEELHSFTSASHIKPSRDRI